jgi:hypothetical protein
MQIRLLIFGALALPILLSMGSCKPSGKVSSKDKDEITNITRLFSEDGVELSLSMLAGPEHNHPSFAVWLETLDGDIIQTLFVTQSLATGFYRYGDAGNGKWLKVSGEAARPAALPYWLYRNELTKGRLPKAGSRLPDAYTGPTPESSARFQFKTNGILPQQFRVLVEVNQPWDWNFHWNNDRFPTNMDYRTSAQPSIVYVVTVNLETSELRYFLNPIGHGHQSGMDGTLNTDLSTITTALRIFDRIYIDVIPTE